MQLVIYSLIVIILCSNGIQSQTIRFNQLTTEDGLSNNNVFEIMQDRLGFLWFATDDGLNRFDGYDFKIFRHDPLNKNSISGNSVWSIKEDHKGNIWTGTKSGWLNCYNPVEEKFREWRIESDITGENTITFIYEDFDYKLWIGTYRSGLYRFNPETEKTDHWLNDPSDTSSLSNNYISSILQDKNGNIWISTYHGLNRIDPSLSLKIFKHYYNIPGNPNSISDNIIWYLTPSESDSNLFWIGTANGLTSYKTDSEKFSQIKITNPENIQFGTSAGSVIEDNYEKEKILWIDSYAGLVRLDRSNGSYERFIADNNNPNSLVSNQINRMIKDRSGVLWIATNNGISSFSPYRSKFNTTLSGEYKFVNLDLINKKNIKAITKTTDSRAWFGTEDGLYYAKNQDRKIIIKQFNHSEKLNIWALTPGNKDDLWIGTYGSGLYKIELKTNRFSHYRYNEKKFATPSVNFVKSICCDDKNNIWIGYWGFGLGCINSSTGEYKHWLNNPDDSNSLSLNDVWVIYQDNKGRMWIGTNGGGLNLAYPQAGLLDEKDSGHFYRWLYEENDPGSLSSNTIYSICELSKKDNALKFSHTVLWIGTNKGLNKFIIKDSDSAIDFPESAVYITRYTTLNGLPDNAIKCLTEDEQGNLWIGTNSGISIYNPDKNKFTNFNNADGITGGSFNSSSVYKYGNGLIFMGSTSGLNWFSPNEIKLSSFIPPVLITDFQIFNKSVKVDKNSILNTSVFNKNEIILSFKHNTFSFKFAALDYSNPASIQYSYKMEGFDKEWVQSGSRRFATYTNLYPGEYIFKVKSTNSDRVWNKNISELKVIILPPWWRTIWAMGFYVLIFLLGIWGIIKFQTYKTRLQNDFKIKELEASHLREIENIKSRFFANLSHEFRTPLTLILGPAEQITRMSDNTKVKEEASLIYRSAKKLNRLANQLLDLSKIEAGKMKLLAKRHDLNRVIEQIISSFQSFAEKKHIRLNFIPGEQKIFIYLDKDKFDKILGNLFSNAIKFTPERGLVNVKTKINFTSGKIIADTDPMNMEKKKNDCHVEISVSDTGIGIPKEQLDKIFDRFYQVDNRLSKEYEGTGIGLSLTKELVELHKGKIFVESVEGKGSEFKIVLPFGKDHLLPEEINQDSISEKEDLPGDVISDINIHKEIKTHSDSELISWDDITNNEKPTVLVIDDNADLRKYITEILHQDYKILEASDGEEGFCKSIKFIPDLIISDVMMPKIDGFTLCNKIKTDTRTSHIPLILLTAKSTIEDKLDGLQTGADAYIMKPFEAAELRVRIMNLIEQRKRVQEHFNKFGIFDLEQKQVTSVDQKFMREALKIIDAHIADPNFNIETFAECMTISRSLLHKKFNSLVGETPGELIKRIRLNRAAKLLANNHGNITEIAFQVGFNDASYFTACFKKQFDISPSQYHQEHNLNT